MKKIKAIIFDVGGVLTLGKKPSLREGRYHNLGVHEYVVKKFKVLLDQYLDAIDTSYAQAIVGEISKEKVVKILAKNFKTTPRKLEKIYIKAYRKNFKQNKQLFKQAFKLKQLGYKIAILSDQWHLSKEALMPNKNYKKFSPVIVSCDFAVKMRKPNPKIYKLTLKKLKLKPSECIFIDNQKWNIESAKKLGIKTILFKSNNQLFKNKLWRGLWG
ncbi:hypothetical protein CMI44_01495 [Candidatus Pacearchaeota archaeon]|nr:hypothetical protein [Candidatus Pacearchaeota archaeon]|tara:strand:+ start:4349 stop:4993 length:645 start_codon:yes stop_codon:yes gene_type:complete